MKSWFLLPLTLCAVVSSQLLLPLIHRPGRGFAGPAIPPSFQQPSRDSPNQAPLMDPLGPGPAIPPSDDNKNKDDPSSPPSYGGGGGPGSVMLSDVMGRDKSINIFAGFTRDIETVSSRLDDSTQNSTVLAPLNSAIEALPRKPWEDPKDYGELGEQAYEGEDGQERAQRNLQRFVEAHVVPKSPWKEGDKVTVWGREVWWEQREGKRVVMPGEIEVVDVASSVANGEVWIIRGVRNY